MRRSTGVFRALAAAAALAVLLVGLPAFLVSAVGWPLPQGIPSLGEIGEIIGGDRPLETATVWKVLAAVLWLAWFQVVVAVTAEARAAVRGGLPRALPGLNLAHGLVAPLVAAIVIAWPAGSSARAAAAPTPVVAEHVADPPIEVAVAPQANEPTQAADVTVEHVVQRRDTLWDLAERYLGDGFRSTELFELNEGRPQPDGRSLTDPGLLRPGWVLNIPAPAPAEPVDSLTRTVVVQTGDSLWELADDHLGDGHRYTEVFDLNNGRPQPDGAALTRPELIRPGWQLDLPSSERAPAVAPPTAAPASDPASAPVPATLPTTTVPTADSMPDATVPQMQAEAVGRAGAVEVVPEVESEKSHRSVGVLGLAGGFLAAGISAAVAVGRRRQRARRRPGTELPTIPQASASVLDAIADLDLDLADRVDRSLRHLGVLLRDRGSVPAPVIVSVHDGYLDLLLDRVHREPPKAWEVDGDGRIWRTVLDRAAAYDREGPAWLPALVSVGCLDDRGILLNLEAVGTVALTGDVPAATALARSFAAELSVTPLADVPAVFLVGDVVAGLTLPNVYRHECLSAAVDAALEHVASIGSALAGSGYDTAVELRCRAPEEAWAPAVVVASTDGVSDDELERVARLGHERVGIAFVLVGEASGAFPLVVDDGRVRLQALDLSCDVQHLDEAAIEQIVDLVESVEEDCVEPAAAQPMTLFEAEKYGVDGRGESSSMHLRLLGPMTVEGAELKPQQLAVVAYLALHGEVTGDALRDAIWGGSTPTRERFLNTLTEIRRAVGNESFPAMTDGRYRLRGVWCDLAEVERLLAVEDAADRAANLRAALELVSGPPLTFDSRHRRHFRWVDTGNHASRWERVVGDAAHELVATALRHDDHDLALWAAERGLFASPGNEALTRDLLAAHMAAGDRSTAEKVAEEYARAMEDLGYDEVPDLLEELLEERRAS